MLLFFPCFCSGLLFIVQGVSDATHEKIQAYCIHCLAVLSTHQEAASTIRELNGLRSVVQLLDPQGVVLYFPALDVFPPNKQRLAVVGISSAFSSSSSSSSSSAAAAFVPFDDLSPVAQTSVPDYSFRPSVLDDASPGDTSASDNRIQLISIAAFAVAQLVSSDADRDVCRHAQGSCFSLLCCICSRL